MSEVVRLLEQYGPGSAHEVFPGTPSDTHWGERFYDAQSALNAGKPASNPVSEALRRFADWLPKNRELPPPQIPFDPRSMSALDMGRGAAKTTANWLDWKPEIGPDTLAPLGIGAGMGLGAAGRAAVMREGLTPGDWLRAKWIEHRLDRMEDGPTASWDRGVTGGDPRLPMGDGFPSAGRNFNPYGGGPRHFDDRTYHNSSADLRERPGVTAQQLGDPFDPAFPLQRATSPANANGRLRADNEIGSAPGTILNGLQAAEQKPTAGRTALSERQAALERGREAFHETGPGSSRANELEYWSPSGRAVYDASFYDALREFNSLRPPTRALSQDATGRFYDKNRLNADSASPPGALANTKPGREENAPTIADLLRQYGGSF